MISWSIPAYCTFSVNVHVNFTRVTDTKSAQDTEDQHSASCDDCEIPATCILGDISPIKELILTVVASGTSSVLPLSFTEDILSISDKCGDNPEIPSLTTIARSSNRRIDTGIFLSHLLDFLLVNMRTSFSALRCVICNDPEKNHFVCIHVELGVCGVDCRSCYCVVAQPLNVMLATSVSLMQSDWRSRAKASDKMGVR